MNFFIYKLAAILVMLNPIMAEEAKPNIILIVTDDQGYQDLGCFGSPHIKTPHIDKMASEGMRFTDFYVSAAICTPSRASIMTGLYPERAGVRADKVFFPNRDLNGLDPRNFTIAEAMKTVGYQTMAIGKWHLGENKPYLPTNHGFDSYYGIPYSNDMYPSKNMEYAEDCLWREGMNLKKLDEAFEGKLSNGNNTKLRKKVPLMRDEQCIEFPVDQSTITRRFTDEALKFIKKSSGEKEPFFLYLSHSMPHIPLYVSADFKGKSEGGLYGDVIEEIDYNVGRIIDELKNLELEDNTILVYTSDNGPWLAKEENGGSALPLFGGKMTVFEGGLRVPTIIKWPAQIPAATVCNKLITTMDLMPTFAAIAGAQLPDKPKLDGKDVLNIWKNEAGASSPHKYFFYTGKAVRSGNWKYHLKQRLPVKGTDQKSTESTLYNLRDNIGESVNLIKEHPEIALRLREALDEHKASLKPISLLD